MTFWVSIYTAAAAQAALLAMSLWRRKVNPEANRALAVWVALVGLDLAVKAVYWNSPGPGWLKPYRFVGLFPFLYGNLFFIYVRALTQARRFELRDLIHLAGFGVMLALNANIFLMNRAETQAMFERLTAGARVNEPWFDFALFAYSLSYVIAGLVLVHRYRRRLHERRADADRMSLHWIDAMAACQIVIWCIAALQWLAKVPGIDYALLFGAVAAWVCVVGWFSLAQPPVATVAEATYADQEADTPAIDDVRFPAVEARLSQLMTGGDALYLEPALTIGQVAKRSGYPEYLVSALINRRFGNNFWDYINRLRIEAARTHLADGRDKRTILDIAYDCGFTSKSTFNAAFKRQVGETPSRYRKRHTRGDTEVSPAPDIRP